MDYEQLPRAALIRLLQEHDASLRDAGKNGIVMSYTELRGTYRKATCELTWALLLAVARHIPQEHASMRAGGWQTSTGIVLSGRTLGLLGLGRQGRYMVPVAKAFGMDVIAWSQNLTPEFAAAHGARGVALAYAGRPAEGAEALQACIRLDPRGPSLVNRLNQLALAYYFCGDYEACVAAADRAISAFPDFPSSYRWRAAALGQLGRELTVEVSATTAATHSPRRAWRASTAASACPR